MNEILTVAPAVNECVVVHAAPGTTIRVIRDGETRDYPATEHYYPVTAVLWLPDMGGAQITVYHGPGGLRGVRNGHHKRDRHIWHQAAAEALDNGVVYVRHAQRNWFGKTVWVAVSTRTQ